MRSWVKRLGYAAGALLSLVTLLLAGVYGFSAVRLRRSFPVANRETITIPTDRAAMARGEHLARTVTKCGDCHGEDMGGRLFIDAGPLVGRIYTPNLTGGRGGVTAAYTPADWERAIRHGVSPTGRALRIMPSNELAGLSDADLADVVAYIRSLPPVDRASGTVTLGPISRALYLAGQFPVLPAEAIDHAAPHPRSVTPGVTREYGHYLADIGGCTGCHGPGLSGGHVAGTPPDFPSAQNLTPAGIGAWTEQDFFRALRTGHRPDGTLISTFMPWQTSGQMTDDELRAVWLYIQSVPPRPSGSR